MGVKAESRKRAMCSLIGILKYMRENFMKFSKVFLKRYLILFLGVVVIGVLSVQFFFFRKENKAALVESKQASINAEKLDIRKDKKDVPKSLEEAKARPAPSLKKPEELSSIEEAKREEERKRIELQKEEARQEAIEKAKLEKEKKEVCEKYEGKFISYYNTSFVKSCKMHQLSEGELGELLRKSKVPVEVPERVVQLLEQGVDYKEYTSKKLSCKDLNQEYVKSRLETYWVENCTLRKFPDVASVENHRSQKDRLKKKIHILSVSELSQFQMGEDIDSVLKEHSPLGELIEREDLERICSEMVGKYVSFFDQIYLVTPFQEGKGCWKKSVSNVAEFTRKNFRKEVMVHKNLDSNEAYTLPDKDLSIGG